MTAADILIDRLVSEDDREERRFIRALVNADTALRKALEAYDAALRFIPQGSSYPQVDDIFDKLKILYAKARKVTPR